MSDSLVSVSGLCKSYGAHSVLNGVEFSLPAGQIVGLFGPNGCGKTTLLKIMSGLIHDYTGELLIDGRKIGPATKSIVAFLPDRMHLPEWMNAAQAIGYFADFFADFDKDKATGLLHSFSLSEKQKIKSMSKGMQEKLLLLLTMSRRARLYLLDEPIGGVDPAARAAILDFIMRNHAPDSTIIMSTHLINDLEQIFSHVIFLGNGKILLNDSVDNIRSYDKSIEDVFKEVFRDAWQIN